MLALRSKCKSGNKATEESQNKKKRKENTVKHTIL